ncbi:hypothetical protein C7M84_006452 [Penaeus vannamei]|uniref:DNA2/NAM7 helicase helicase domain-containing protein n=1 Tax=Penaeus vannamei TaxID=6689 RepID=A0A423UAU5_PENVA|nr:hypothetical protein C7M84_006452 [Penaeus vannamei]
MTTTGAAQYSAVMQDLSPAIVIIEEAAEILESHVITALTSKCQHLILIGDHQQLRPSATVYELATKYGLETSLFERMIKNGLAKQDLPRSHLNTRRVMHNVGTHPVIIGGVSAVFGKLGYLQLLRFERSRCVGLVFGNWCRTNGWPERRLLLPLVPPLPLALCPPPVSLPSPWFSPFPLAPPFPLVLPPPHGSPPPWFFPSPGSPVVLPFPVGGDIDTRDEGRNPPTDPGSYRPLGPLRRRVGLARGRVIRRLFSPIRL